MIYIMPSMCRSFQDLLVVQVSRVSIVIFIYQNLGRSQRISPLNSFLGKSLIRRGVSFHSLTPNREKERFCIASLEFWT